MGPLLACSCYLTYSSTLYMVECSPATDFKAPVAQATGTWHRQSDQAKAESDDNLNIIITNLQSPIPNPQSPTIRNQSTFHGESFLLPFSVHSLSITFSHYLKISTIFIRYLLSPSNPPIRYIIFLPQPPKVVQSIVFDRTPEKPERNGTKVIQTREQIRPIFAHDASRRDKNHHRAVLRARDRLPPRHPLVRAVQSLLPVACRRHLRVGAHTQLDRRPRRQPR